LHNQLLQVIKDRPSYTKHQDLQPLSLLTLRVIQQLFDLLATTNTTWQREKAAGVESGGFNKSWLRAVDNLL
jgi:hypothetical protein